MASIRYREERGTWEVAWKELYVTVTEDGTQVRKWKSRRRTCPSHEVAKAVKLQVENAAAQGVRWEDAREAPVSTIGSVCKAFIRASARSRSASTARFRTSMLARYQAWAGEETSVEAWTTGHLTDYADFLRDDGVRSVARYVSTVEQLWRWAFDRVDTYPGVPMPKRVTGADGEVQHAPAPIAIDTPTWADVELMLDALTPDGCARWIERERERIAQETGCSAEEVDMRGFGYRPQWELHRQIALVQRWTGLRISQILSLTWEDLDLERRRLRIRQGTKGAKGQARDRIVPMHPSLAEELAGWGVREGHLFARMATKGAQRGQMLPLRGDGVAEVFTAAWKRAGVAPAKWDAVGREKARPTNAIRARWKSSIAGVAGYDLAKLMLGQSGGGEHDSYVAMGTPEASPYWSRMVSALTVLAAPSGDLGTSSHEVPDPPSSGH